MYNFVSLSFSVQRTVYYIPPGLMKEGIDPCGHVTAPGGLVSYSFSLYDDNARVMALMEQVLLWPSFHLQCQ
jgi:hypothetical protein